MKSIIFLSTFCAFQAHAFFWLSSCPKPSAPYFAFHADHHIKKNQLERIKKGAPGAMIGSNPIQEKIKLEVPDDYFDKVVPAFEKTNTALKDQGFKTSVYLEGPHGQTGDEWTAEEKERMERLAKEYFHRDKNPGTESSRDHWFKKGWLDYHKRQLVAYNKMGVDAFETDNLANDFAYAQEHKDRKAADPKDEGSIQGSPKAFVRFYIDLFKWMKKQKPAIKMKPILKNPTPDELIAINDAIKWGSLSRKNFADYIIVEKINDDKHASETENIDYRKLQTKEAARMGFQVIASDNTYNYHSEGKFDPKCKGELAEHLPDADVNDNVQLTLIHKKSREDRGQE
jgi:hypothetical protein